MPKEKEAEEPPLTFTLQVHNSSIPCSKRVVLSSSLLVDIMELIKDDADRFVFGKIMKINLNAFHSSAQFLFPNSSPNKLYWIGPRWSRKETLNALIWVILEINAL